MQEYSEDAKFKNSAKIYQTQVDCAHQIPQKDYDPEIEISLHLSQDSNSESEKIIHSEKRKECLVDIKILNLRKSHNYSVFDIFLSMLEAVWNCKSYSFDSSNKSHSFWEKVVNSNEFKNIFSSTKAETLRKYWRIIHEGLNLRKCANSVIKIKMRNKPECVTLKKLSLFVKVNTATINREDYYGFEKKFQDYLRSDLVCKSNSGQLLKNKSKRNKEPVDESTIIKLIRREDFQEKSNEDNINEETRTKIKKNASEIQLQKANLNSKIEDKENQENEKKSDLNDQTKCLEEIISTLKNLFPEKNLSEEEIINCLSQCSMNLQSTFEYFKNPDQGNPKLFTENEDFIILNKKDTCHYETICQGKGKDTVRLREDFLKN